MPSPFPGMDPYLEGELWGSFHAQLIAEIARQLAPQLRPKYLALMEKRFVTYDPAPEDGVLVSTAGDERSWTVPDVAVVDVTERRTPTGGASTLTAPLQLETVMAGPVPQHWIEIRDAANRHLVTAIELLSPANKSGEGRFEYYERRGKLLASTAHLMEIDLLRKGKRPPMRERLPDFPFFAFLSRAHRRPVTEVWPIRLDEPLPRVPVPLVRPDPDVTMNLQEAFVTVYDQLGYDLAVDYRRPPEVKLPEAHRDWAAQRIREHGRV